MFDIPPQSSDYPNIHYIFCFIITFAGFQAIYHEFHVFSLTALCSVYNSYEPVYVFIKYDS